VLCTRAIFFGKGGVKRLTGARAQNFFRFRKSDPQSIHIPVAACHPSETNFMPEFESPGRTFAAMALRGAVTYIARARESGV
jgi:hypothetical protein